MLIGVFTSGGDAPGMNACLRAVVRSALAAGHEVLGICGGYQGLLDEAFFLNAEQAPRMTLRSVSGLSQRGGTLLGTSRCEEFRTAAGQQRAADILRKHGVDALVPIGGDGTFRGALALAQCWDGQVICCPGTIDNDLLGTDFTIGFFTAVQTAVDAVDKIRDTAESHQRMFLIEVMGRHSGYIAAYTAIAVGAEIACIPETHTDISQIVQHVEQLKARGKKSVMIVVAEGDERGSAEEIKQQLEKAGCPFSMRVVVLGHLQRGGAPGVLDRILASRMGDFAVRSILAGETGMLAGIREGKAVLTPLADTFAGHKEIPREYLDLLETLSQ